MKDLFGDLSDLFDLSDHDPGLARINDDATPLVETVPRKIAPRVGTTIQRGDAASRRRAIFLAEPIPPRPARRAQEKARKSKTERCPTTNSNRSWDFKRPGVLPANASTRVSSTSRPTTVARKPTDAVLRPSTQQRPIPVDTPTATATTIQPIFRPTSQAKQLMGTVLPRTTRPIGQLQRPGSISVPAASKQPQPPPMAIVAATTIVPTTPVSSPPVTTGKNTSSTATTVQNPAGATTIRVRLPTGKEVPVPFFPGSRHRKYRIRIENEKWVIRFDREGHPTSCRKR